MHMKEFIKIVVQKLGVNLEILYNTLFQKKKVKNLMRLFIKTKELSPVKTIKYFGTMVNMLFNGN